MKHLISVHTEVKGENPPHRTALIRKCIRTVLDAEHVTVPCEINVLITDNEGIRVLNREYRNVDAATDVLSFPMFELIPGAFPEDAEDLLDPGDATLPLGDMALSAEKIRAQAAEFGHSEDREIGYLTVHSTLHLLGYDHMDEGKMKRQMREREEYIVSLLGLTR